MSEERKEGYKWCSDHFYNLLKESGLLDSLEGGEEYDKCEECGYQDPPETILDRTKDFFIHKEDDGTEKSLCVDCYLIKHPNFLGGKVKD